MNRFKVLIAVATVATGGALLVPTVASAHANSVQCVDQATSTWRITNDHELSETFTSSEGPSGSVAAGAGSFTDVVWNGDTLTVTGTWTDGFVGTTVGTGDCSPEVQPTTTTTIAPTTTTLVTTTTAQETTTSLPPTTAASSTTTTVPPTTTSTEPVSSSSTTTPSTTPTSTPTTSGPSSTLPPPSSAPTTPPPTSTPSSPSTSAPRPCTPSVTTSPPGSPATPPGTPSAPPCGRLPATGNPDLVILTVIAAATIIAGAFMLTKTRR